MIALDVVRVVVLLRVVDVVRVVVLQLVVDVVALRRSVPLPDQQRMLRRLVFYTKGEFTDIAHKDDCNPVSFVEYSYAVKTTQPNVLELVSKWVFKVKANQTYKARLVEQDWNQVCLLYTSPSPRDRQKSRMPSSA